MYFQQEAPPGHEIIPNGKGAGGCRRGHSALNDSLVFCCVVFLFFFKEAACLTRPHFLVHIPYLFSNYTFRQRLPVCETDFIKDTVLLYAVLSLQ